MPDNSQVRDKKEKEKAKLYENLGHRLWQAQHAVERAMDDALSPVGIRVTQGAALLYLHQQPGLSGAELARRLLLTPQSVATLLAGFEARGWVKRTPHPVHKVFREATLTDAGRNVLIENAKVVARINQAISQDLTEREFAQLYNLLGRIMKNAQTLSAREANSA